MKLDSINIIGQTRERITTQYAKYITGQSLNDSFILIGENLGKELGNFDKSDIIMLFSKDDTCMMSAERIHKEDYGRLEWYLIMLKAYRNFKAVEDTYEDLLINLTISKEYVEIIACREEWYQCVQEVFGD